MTLFRAVANHHTPRFRGPDDAPTDLRSDTLPRRGPDRRSTSWSDPNCHNDHYDHHAPLAADSHHRSISDPPSRPALRRPRNDPPSPDLPRLARKSATGSTLSPRHVDCESQRNRSGQPAAGNPQHAPRQSARSLGDGRPGTAAPAGLRRGARTTWPDAAALAALSPSITSPRRPARTKATASR